MRQLLGFLALCLPLAAQSWTEFYCDASQSNNMNGGSNAGSPTLTVTNGGWNATTGVFTGTISGVTVGQFANVYNDGATTPVFIGRVTAADASTITVDVATAYIGTAPTTSATGRSIKVGGAWKCMNAAVGFPLAGTPAITTALAASNTYPRLNMLSSGGAFDVTASVTWATAGPMAMQGYTTTAGDGGRFTMSTASGFVGPLSLSGSNLGVVDGVIAITSTGGTSTGLALSGVGTYALRMTVHGARGHGFTTGSNPGQVIMESEAYDNGKGGTTYAGFSFGTGSTCIRCYSHDNTSSGTTGFLSSTATAPFTLIDSIADSNNGSGIEANSYSAILVGVDAYNNGGDGLKLTNTSGYSLHVENSNFFLNGGYGINGSGSGARSGIVANCMFGRGNKSNNGGSGSTAYDYTGLKATYIVNPLTYTADATPWSAPTTGDFRITGAANQGTGRGYFMASDGTNSGTVNYPDIGAGQRTSVQSGGASGGAVTVVQ